MVMVGVGRAPTANRLARPLPHSPPTFSPYRSPSLLTAYPETGTSAALEVVFNKGFDGRGRPSYANGSGLNGQESPFCGAVFVA